MFGCQRTPLVTSRDGLMIAALLLAGCASATHSNTHISAPITAHESARPVLAPIDVPLRLDEPLEPAFHRVLQTYLAENYEPFDARRAYATSAAAGFARYFTINTEEPGQGRVNHVFFVSTAEWTEERTRDFLISYLVMPAAPDMETGRLRFHFQTAYPLPWAVRFVFGNGPMGAFEAAVLSELGTTEWRAEAVEILSGRITALLERVGLVDRESLSQRCPEALDAVFRALPRPPEETREGVFEGGYVPQGSLAAIGLLVGESIRAEVPGAIAWEADDASLYPRLRVTGLAEGIMRPIPMMVEIFAAEADVMPTSYCNRMIDNLAGRVGEE